MRIEKSELFRPADHRRHLGRGAAPWTFAGSTTSRPRQPRRARIRIKSCTAAPVGEVTNPIVAGIAGSGFFRGLLKQALLRQPALERLELALQLGPRRPRSALAP